MDKFLLYGPSASGKSTAGILLAAELALPFIDLDLEIEHAAGMPVSEIFAARGEAGFRALESQLLGDFLSKPGEAVVALGGGALLLQANRTLAEGSGPVLCLRAGEKTILSRSETDETVRPLLAGDREERVRDYLAGRESHYDSFALQLHTDALTPEEIAWQAQLRFGAFRLTKMGSPYDVRARRGGLAALGEWLQQRNLQGPICIVADTNTIIHARTAQERIESAGYTASLAVIPAGESHKNLHSVQELWNAFLKSGLERGSTIVAVGGGVVTDLAGFAAATYMRGIAWVAVPTSLLGMVDAAIGGKTGADLPQGKNLIGAFHPPRLVLVDPDVLATLPPRELRAGQAEMIKAGVIGAPGLFAAFRRPDFQEELPAWISTSIGVKVRLIEADPFEGSVRGRLNFGHTIGHAVEHASGYELLHGEAIAIGMVLETRLAEDIGYAKPGTMDAVRYVLARAGLPVELPAGIDTRTILQTMQRDKKKSAGALRFALPRDIGSVEMVQVRPESYQRLL